MQVVTNRSLTAYKYHSSTSNTAYHVKYSISNFTWPNVNPDKRVLFGVCVELNGGSDHKYYIFRVIYLSNR